MAYITRINNPSPIDTRTIPPTIVLLTVGLLLFFANEVNPRIAFFDSTPNIFGVRQHLLWRVGTFVDNTLPRRNVGNLCDGPPVTAQHKHKRCYNKNKQNHWSNKIVVILFCFQYTPPCVLRYDLGLKGLL